MLSAASAQRRALTERTEGTGIGAVRERVAPARRTVMEVMPLMVLSHTKLFQPETAVPSGAPPKRGRNLLSLCAATSELPAADGLPGLHSDLVALLAVPIVIVTPLRRSCRELRLRMLTPVIEKPPLYLLDLPAALCAAVGSSIFHQGLVSDCVFVHVHSARVPPSLHALFGEFVRALSAAPPGEPSPGVHVLDWVAVAPVRSTGIRPVLQ